MQDDREFDSEALSEDQDVPAQRPDAEVQRQGGAKSKKEQRGAITAERLHKNAELELLMMDDNALMAARDGVNVGLSPAGAFPLGCQSHLPRKAFCVSS
jgi:hypothetical protein